MRRIPSEHEIPNPPIQYWMKWSAIWSAEAIKAREDGEFEKASYYQDRARSNSKHTRDGMGIVKSDYDYC